MLLGNSEHSDTLSYLYSAGGTRRYHNRPGLNQDVAQHSWGVVMIITLLHPNPSANLLKAAAMHDCPEKVYGDLLRPLKNDFPEAKELDEKCTALFWSKMASFVEFPKLTPLERRWLDFADLYECCLFSKNLNEEIYVSSLLESRKMMEEIVSLTPA